jgi:Cft2 family RNA processing exonuclease
MPETPILYRVGTGIDFTPQGIYVRDIDLWLDPRDRCTASWLSHAHSDHARGLHCTVFATARTLELYRLRWPEDDEYPQKLVALEYGRPQEWNGARLTAYPASHILGAAQLLIEWRGERILYTGDIKLRPPLCGDTTEIVPCDRLIIESTFGLPIYRFLDRDTARQRIVRCAREALEDGRTPVFVGYPLGRGQEIVHVLCEAGIPTAVHGSIARMIPAYEAAGYRFPGWEPYAQKLTAGKALVVVHGMRDYLEASGKDVRVAYVSGWAGLDNARTRAGAEELIPYSDHADFTELIELVRGTGAKRVDVVHGYTEPFARILRSMGIDAHAQDTEAGTVAEAEG